MRGRVEHVSDRQVKECPGTADPRDTPHVAASFCPGGALWAVRDDGAPVVLGDVVTPVREVIGGYPRPTAAAPPRIQVGVQPVLVVAVGARRHAVFLLTEDVVGTVGVQGPHLSRAELPGSVGKRGYGPRAG